MRPIRTYWCRGCGAGRNFGDQLGPVLLRHYGITPAWSRPARSELVTVGSVLSKIPATWAGFVLGTGLIAPSMRRRIPRAKVLGVRGALTRDACGLSKATQLGDPGILVTDLADVSAIEREGEAIIPHYVDHEMAARHPLRRIDIRSSPASFIEQVAGASLVYTSSLHALITADALGVPHVLELHPSVIGGVHKFNDYASAFGESIRPGVPRLTNRAAMAQRQAELRSTYGTLARALPR